MTTRHFSLNLISIVIFEIISRRPCGRARSWTLMRKDERRAFHPDGMLRHLGWVPAAKSGSLDCKT